MKKFSEEDIVNYPGLASTFIESNRRRSQYDWLYGLMKLMKVLMIVDLFIIVILFVFWLYVVK